MSRLAMFLTAVILAAGTSAEAGPFQKLLGNWDVTNNSNSSANDFHMKVKQPGGAAVQIGAPDQFYNDGFFDNRSAAVTSGGPNTDLIIDLDWVRSGPGLISIGQTIHIGFQFQSTNPTAQVVDAYWTADGVKTGGEQPKLPGFEVGSFGLTNDTGSPLVIQDLNFQVNSTLIPLSALLPYTLSGFGTSAGLGMFVPTFTIPIGGVVDVTPYLPALPGAGQFLTLQFTSYSSGSPSLSSRGMYEIEGPLINAIPEPSTMTTAGVFGFALALGWSRRRRRAAGGAGAPPVT